MKEKVNILEEKKTIFSSSKEKILSIAKEKKYIMVADEETGQIKGYFPLNQRKLGKDWIALYQNSSIWLAQQHLTGEQFRVMHVLVGKLDFDNYLIVDRQDIANLIGIRATHVSRAMSKLKNLNIIVEGPNLGKFKTYRLNPHIAHKGKNVEETILEFDSCVNSMDI